MNPDEISILIVDDEPEARDLLSLLLAQIENVRIVGEAECTDDAIELVLKYNPDLILLDIQMPEKSGFELIRELRARNLNPEYIFVTAYDQYAINAIKATALDYLLKPIDIDEIHEAISRYRHKKSQQDLNARLDTLLSTIVVERKIRFNTRRGFTIINTKDIVYCLADGNYTDIILSQGRKETVTCNLGGIIQDLSEKDFFRISRSAIINLDFLTHVDNKSSFCRLHYEPPVILKVSRNRLSELKCLSLNRDKFTDYYQTP